MLYVGLYLDVGVAIVEVFLAGVCCCFIVICGVEIFFSCWFRVISDDFLRRGRGEVFGSWVGFLVF